MPAIYASLMRNYIERITDLTKKRLVIEKEVIAISYKALSQKVIYGVTA
jgi:hypothetical protein